MVYLSSHTLGNQKPSKFNLVFGLPTLINQSRMVKKSTGLLQKRGLESRFFMKATHVNDPGSIDSPLIQSMEEKINEHLNAESVIVKDASGDGRHVCIDVVSSAFEGQSVVNRQRMVYKAVWEELQNTVHAVDQMTTRTPSEAASQKLCCSDSSFFLKYPCPTYIRTWV